MTRFLVSLLLAGLLGCSAPYEIDRGIEPPVLLSYAPLPPYPTPSLYRPLKLKVMICVTKDGTVGHARLLTSSGNAHWDSLAEQSIKQWQYAPPRRNGEPADVWVQQRVTVQFDGPTFMSLAELAVTSPSLADSLYSLLQRGEVFEDLARRYSESPSRDDGGGLGSVNIQMYPSRIWESLRRLNVGGITRPLHSGSKLVIFKRLKD